jgi:hypothetical protein
MTYDFKLSCTLPASPGAIYDAWLDSAKHSAMITVELAPTQTGARLTLTHSGVPDGQTSYEKGGWQDNYFAPMKAYFASAKTGRGPAGKPPGIV